MFIDHVILFKFVRLFLKKNHIIRALKNWIIINHMHNKFLWRTFIELLAKAPSPCSGSITEHFIITISRFTFYFSHSNINLIIFACKDLSLFFLIFLGPDPVADT